jgi:Putative peptidoglycan binding domain
MKSVTQLAGLVLFGAWLTSSAVVAAPGGFHGGGFHGSAAAGANGRGAAAFRGSRGFAGRPGFIRGRNGHYFRYDRYRHRFVDVGFFGYPFGFYDYGYPYWYGYDYPYGYDYYGYDPNYDYQAAANQGPGVPNIGVAVQAELARHGYYGGPLDGVIGSETRRAVRRYQEDHGLPVTGEITPELLASMKLRPRD